jgi:hypothetical protein
LQAFTAAADRHRAISVGSIDACSSALERFDRRCGRMAEQIVAADGDDGELRRDRADKLGRRRVSAPVMADFQDVGAQVGAARENTRFRVGSGIAREKHAKVPILQPKDE